jgi:hypothetical protein
MRIGPRMPSLRKRVAARTSWKRYVRHSLGLKAPRGMGWITNPRRAAYNRAYNRLTFDPLRIGRRRWTTGGRGVGVVIFGLIVLVLILRAMAVG